MDCMTELPARDRRSSPAGEAVLVSGASFAGLATAYWMNRLGYRVTVVELSGGLRRGGTPVDLEGEAIDALARMGVLDAVRAKALPPRRFEFKDAADVTLGAFSGEPDADDAEPSNERLEVHRDDLLDILFALIVDRVEVVFDSSIRELEQGPDGVAVTFADGSRSDYALVFGCDGNRSKTRRLAFEDASNVSHFMGGYFFIKVVPVTGLLPPDRSQLFSTAGRTALLNGYDNQTDIALAFRTAREVDYDYRDRVQQRRMVHEHFDGLRWKIPAMLKHMDADDDFYFDKLNQIRMPCWSNDRIVLVGDAGYCVSPVAGMGGFMAIIGAARLADALRRHGGDYSAAFKDYDAGLRPFVDEVQERAVTQGMATMFPADDAELAERDRRLGEGTLDL
jgi:2-polyprenyl-6-methoxyphenol hydroxylase-like FAD-dependent oxidoreductase